MPDDRSPLTSRRQKDFGSTSDQQFIDESEMTSREKQQKNYEQWGMPLIAEFVGMLIFTFMHSLAIQSPVAPLAPAINDGFFVAVMVITIGHISGAHVNAAVTVAVTLSGGLKWVMAPLYIIVQLLGSLVGAALARVAFGQPTGNFVPGVGITDGQAVLTEIMLTVILVFAVLQSAVDLGTPLAAFAIGFAIVIDIFVGATISGACMNPSLSFGPAVVTGVWRSYWIYWVGPIVGALIATFIHKLFLGSRKQRAILGDCGNDDGESTPMKRQDGGESSQPSPL